MVPVTDASPALPLCVKCKSPLPEGASFCPFCGKKVNSTARPSPKPKVRGNGTGSVYRRGNAWCAEKTTSWVTGPNGKLVRKKIRKSGFPTKKAALEYLPYLIPALAPKKVPTLRQLYDAWEPTHRAGDSTMGCYRSAFNHFQPLWSLPIDRIDIDDLQSCLDECGKGKRTRQNMKALCGLLYKYAIPRNLVSLNLGQYLIVGDGEQIKRVGLPLDVLHLIESAVGRIPYADYIVAQCYTGFRPSEFLTLDVRDYDRAARTLKGGAKTDAGKNRIVPVSPRIQPTVDRLVGSRLSGPVFCSKDGGYLGQDEYREIFYAVLDQAGISNPYVGEGDMRRHLYSPHSCRHTFATLLKNTAGADKDKMALIGHSSSEMLRYYQDTDTESLRRIIDAF